MRTSPPAFDSFEDWRAFCTEYRMSLGKIARLTACLLPEPALAAASRRLSNALQACSARAAKPCCPGGGLLLERVM